MEILKPCIVHNGLPEKEILDAVFASVARKYSIEISEMYTMKMFCEELIHEIICDVFVFNDKKEEYVRQLSGYMKDAEETKTPEYAQQMLIELNSQQDYRKKLDMQYSFLLSLSAAVLTTMMSVIMICSEALNKFEGMIYPFENGVVWLTLAVIFACILPVVVMVFVKSLYASKKKPQSEEMTDSIESKVSHYKMELNQMG
jgi:hypothetical protein